jgi:HAE1 family hydrophobic/amphiphilic exporter-1
MYSLIGILLLMGIVKKNSILLVEFANQYRERHPDKSVDEALTEACPVRLRPILMTSFSTICGAIPGALARGDGSETTNSMAAAVMGGVFVSTLLTLLVVPSFYSLVSRLERREDREERRALAAAEG